MGILSYKEIYLLGCDASYVEKVPGVIKNKRGEYVSKENLDVNHFRPDYFGKGTTYNTPKSEIFHFPAWRLFYQKYVKNNSKIKIYNCSRKGRLSFFDFIDYDSIDLK